MKIMYMGRRLNGRYDSVKAKAKRGWEHTVRFFKFSMYTAMMIAIGVFFGSTTVVDAHYNTVQLPVLSPVLDRIADCESGARKANGKAIPGSAIQFRPDGQVVYHANKNGTIDLGKYGINTVWFKQAHALNLNLAKEEDNRKMAEWIYANRGTEDWYSSKTCWF